MTAKEVKEREAAREAVATTLRMVGLWLLDLADGLPLADPWSEEDALVVLERTVHQRLAEKDRSGPLDRWMVRD